MPPRIRRRITNARREQIEEEQKLLEKSIVRPFDISNGLPVSFGPPPTGHYEDVLKHPLTVKDSGVFYRSLMKSRFNYVHICPMFRLYWVKQSSYAKKLAAIDKSPKFSKEANLLTNDRTPVLSPDTSARDVMVKLCDASMTLGPHEFEIRLFIVKDERTEKKKDKLAGLTNSSSAPPPAGPVSTPNPTVSQPSSSLQSLSVNQAPNPTVKSEPEKSISAPKVDLKPVTSNGEAAAPISSDSNGISKDNHTVNEVSGNSTLNNQPKDGDNNVKETESKVNAAKSDTPTTNTSNSGPVTTNSAPNTSNSGPTTTNSGPTTISSGPTTTNSGPSTSNSVPLPAPPPPQHAPPPPQPSRSSDPHNMQSVENTIMISNLNTIARTDESLNQLMKIVALGKADPQQILTFQDYIKRAREMGPQPHHAYLFANQPYAMKPLKEKKPPKDKKPKDMLPRSQKLTSFQEKYAFDATLLFEFVENPNVRFMLPKAGICEVLPPTSVAKTEEEETRDVLISFMWIHNQKEIDDYEKSLAEYNKIMKEREEEAKQAEEKTQENAPEATITEDNATTVAEPDTKVVENEVNSTPDEPAAKTLESEETDASKTKTENADESGTTEAEAEGNIEVKEEPVAQPVASKRRLPPRKASKKKRPPPRRGPKKIERPIEPEIRFTSLSYTIHGIPLKFVPIIANSFEPLEKVQEKFKRILEVGQRMSNFYLWYQVDGKLDEKLAEEVRSQLVQEEKKMQGVVSTIKEVKKRPKKDPMLVKPKKIKLEGEIATPPSSNGSNMDGNGFVTAPTSVPQTL